jgi:hypothetical protein
MRYTICRQPWTLAYCGQHRESPGTDVAPLIAMHSLRSAHSS